MFYLFPRLFRVSFRHCYALYFLELPLQPLALTPSLPFTHIHTHTHTHTHVVCLFLAVYSLWVDAWEDFCQVWAPGEAKLPLSIWLICNLTDVYELGVLAFLLSLASWKLRKHVWLDPSEYIEPKSMHFVQYQCSQLHLIFPIFIFLNPDFFTDWFLKLIF